MRWRRCANAAADWARRGGDLPNLAAILRSNEPIRVGLATMEYFEAPHNQWFRGSFSAVGHSTWTISYADGSTLVMDNENEARSAIDVCALPQWRKLVAKVKSAFDYLEDRLTNQCATPYWCREQHRITGLLRAFNPAFAYGKVDSAWVHQLADLPCFAHLPGVTHLLQSELSDYVVACRGTQFDHRDVKSFTSDVLAWWAANCTKFPTWAIAARIAFSLSPNSASCERVFSLLQCVFGPDRAKSLADQIEASIMLRFNSNQRNRTSM